MVASRFDVFLVRLDPTVGTELQTTRPCLVVSPDEMNQHIRTVIVAPMTPGTAPSTAWTSLRYAGWPSCRAANVNSPGLSAEEP